MARRWLPRGRWVKIGVILLGVVVVLAVAACIALQVLRPHLPTDKELTEKARVQAALTGGAKTYAATCAYCHDTKIGPGFAGLNLPREAISTFVRQGSGTMPAFSPGSISDADLTALAAYVSQLSNQPAQGATK